MRLLHQQWLFLLAAALLCFPGSCWGFTSVPSFVVIKDLPNVWGKLFPPAADKAAAAAATTERLRLKEALLQECRRPTKVDRLTIETMIPELSRLSPIQATAASPMLQKKWMLEWTSEKEINLFIDQKWSSRESIYQVIDGSNLQNMIPFRNGGGSFGVQGTLSIDDPNGQRTNFVFSTATLDLGKWGKYNIPPVGKGWFDTLYLDDDFRVDVNSRDDILICTASPN